MKAYKVTWLSGFPSKEYKNEDDVEFFAVSKLGKKGGKIKWDKDKTFGVITLDGVVKGHAFKVSTDDCSRFFKDDAKFMAEVNLTQAEWKFLDELEYSIYKSSGYKNLSGGHCLIHIVDREDVELENDGRWLHLHIQVGVEGEHLSTWGEATYDRHSRELLKDDDEWGNSLPENCFLLED